MKKRVFSATLAGCMMLTMVPVTAFAANEDVAVHAEKAAVEEGRIECAQPGDTNIFIGGKIASDFIDNRTGQVKLVRGYTDFNTALAADRSGYYLPLVVYVPGATADTDIVLVNGHSNPEGDAITKEDKIINVFDAKDNDIHGNPSSEDAYINLATQIARMDGVLKNEKLTVEVWMGGVDGGQDQCDYVMEYDFSGAKLADSAKYKTAELKVDSTATDYFGKRASALYNVRSNTVNLITDYTGFSSKAEERSGYYLPLKLELDVCADTVVTVQKGKNEDGTDKTADITVDDGVLKLVQRIAGTDGKLLRDQVTVTVYPQGKGEGMPSKTYTYDLSGVTLEQGLEIEAVPVQKSAVKADAPKALETKNNLDQVQSIDFKDGVLTVRANVGAAVALGDGAGAGSVTEKRIPVLFTATKAGKSVVAANAAVENYGGKSGTHTLVWVDLVQGQAGDDKVTVSTSVAGLSKEVKVNIVDISNAPVLKTEASVAVENGVMTGLTAKKEAVTVAEVKEMYAANGGSIVIETAGGRELKDGEKIATGSVIILKDKDGNKVEEITVVVKGDVRGDGVMGLGQLVAAAQAVNGKAPLTGAYLAAGDINGDGTIGLGDLVGMAALLK